MPVLPVGQLVNTSMPRSRGIFGDLYSRGAWSDLPVVDAPSATNLHIIYSPIR